MPSKCLIKNTCLQVHLWYIFRRRHLKLDPVYHFHGPFMTVLTRFHCSWKGPYGYQSLSRKGHYVKIKFYLITAPSIPFFS